MVMIHDLKHRDRGGGHSFKVSTRGPSNHRYGVGDADGVTFDSEYR